MANNVMPGVRVCDGYLVCLDLCIDSPTTVPEINLATSRALRWFFLEEERVMQQSSASISLSENQGINPVGGYARVPRTYTKQITPRNQCDKGLSIPSWSLTRVRFDRDNKINKYFWYFDGID